jgi:hypothetical protein
MAFLLNSNGRVRGCTPLVLAGLFEASDGSVLQAACQSFVVEQIASIPLLQCCSGEYGEAAPSPTLPSRL